MLKQRQVLVFAVLAAIETAFLFIYVDAISSINNLEVKQMIASFRAGDIDAKQYVLQLELLDSASLKAHLKAFVVFMVMIVLTGLGFDTSYHRGLSDGRREGPESIKQLK